MIEAIVSLFSALLVTLGLSSAPNLIPPVPKHIVSMNLCADQYLLALADRGQITALTQYAHDPAMSYDINRAAKFPTTRGSAEELLMLAPDMVIANAYQRTEIETVLGKNVQIIDLPEANTYPQILDNIRLVAKSIGHVERGEALIAQMNTQMPALQIARKKPVAAYYQRRGYMTGTGTLVDDMIQHAGLTNLAARLNKPVLARLSLEEMVVAQPDYLIVESATDIVTDQGTEMLHHPVLANIKRIRLSQALTVCGGPSYPDAVRRILAQMQK